MKNITKMSAAFISLALTMTSIPLPAFSLVAIQAPVSQSAVSGGITVLPSITASPNIGNGSLLSPTSRLNLGGSLALPQSPIVSAPGVQTVVTFTAAEADAAAAPVAAEGVAAAPVLTAPAQAQQTQLAVLSAEASAQAVAVPVQRQSLIGRVASALAAKISIGQVFDNSRTPAAGNVLGVQAQAAPVKGIADTASNENPVKYLAISGDGIHRSGWDVANETQQMAMLLKRAGQDVLNLERRSRNGYGEPLMFVISYRTQFPTNPDVYKASQVAPVMIHGIFGGDSVAKIGEMVNVLKAADQIILDVTPTSNNAYGKILSADIRYISRYDYERIMGAAAPGTTPAPGAVTGILPQKKASLPGMILDDAPSAPDPIAVKGVSIENFNLSGALDTSDNIFSGGPIVLQADATKEADIERALRAMIDADPAKYGVPSSQLATVHVRRVAGVKKQTDTIYAYFQQKQGDFVMHGSGLSFTIKVIRGKPVVMASSAKLYPNAAVDTTPRFSDDELKAKALERLGPYSHLSDMAANFLEKKIVYVKGAWHAANIYLVQIPLEDHSQAIMVGVDVATGEAFTWDPTTLRPSRRTKDAGVSGTTSGKSVEPGPIMPGAKVTEIALSDLEVKIGGKTYLTDKDGRFKADPSLVVGPKGLQLTATLSGPHARITDDSGKTLSVNVLVKPGDKDLKVVFNPKSDLNDENSLAQVSAFHNVNADYDFLKARKLTTDRMDKEAIVVHTNVDDQCNAYYTPGTPSLNFFKSSDDCVNSSYATVSRHEYGHYWDDMTGGIVNGGLSEGWGDTLSMFSLNNPIIGEHFLKKPRPGPDGKMIDYIRDGNNTYQYTDENDEVHNIGQAWGGFNWKLRKALMEKLGDAAGAALAESLILPTMFAKANNVPAAMAQVLLADMDPKGHMPHEAEIRAAAAAHGVTLPQNPGKIMTLAQRLTNTVTGAIQDMLRGLQNA
jgi:hypothetical protein